FLAAKWAGIRVDEFGVGFPPKLFGWKPKKSETGYTVNAIPFGGFVRIFGEDPNNEEVLSGKDAERSLLSKPRIVQAWVMFAGVFFNFLLAWILISAGFMSGLPSPVSAAPEGAVVEDTRLVITSAQEGAPAYLAGLRTGDEILAITTDTEALQDVNPDSVSTFIQAHGTEELAVLYKRADVQGTIFVTPSNEILEGRSAIGISMDTIGILQLPVHKAFWEGGKTTIALTIAITVGFYDLIHDAIVGTADLGSVRGPIGIIGLVGDAANFGFIYLLGFTAFISINLGVINLIPFPALDGGRILFLIIEAIKRSPIKPAVAQWTNAIGFFILIALMLIVTYNDIARLITG
ncbi:RIP metalloprotease, partial [Patescibacteria group bacterium]